MLRPLLVASLILLSAGAAANAAEFDHIRSFAVISKIGATITLEKRPFFWIGQENDWHRRLENRRANCYRRPKAYRQQIFF